MPEGPSILLMKEELIPFTGEKIIAVGGNAKVNKEALMNKTLSAVRTFGKQTFLIVDDLIVRIHLLMFGSYSIQEQTRPDKSLRLFLQFKSGTLYFYTCSVKLLDIDILDQITWEADVLSDQWDPKTARKKLKQLPDMMVCDALLDQDIFSGVGNIIKNEVLFRIGVQPESLVGKLPAGKLTLLIKEARDYSFDFLNWKRAFVLKKHWLVHTKKICPVCAGKLIKKYTGKHRRRSFYCELDQKIYGE